MEAGTKLGFARLEGWVIWEKERLRVGPDGRLGYVPGWSCACRAGMGESGVGSSGWGLKGIGTSLESPACHAGFDCQPVEGPALGGRRSSKVAKGRLNMGRVAPLHICMASIWIVLPRNIAGSYGIRPFRGMLPGKAMVADSSESRLEGHAGCHDG